MEKMNHSDNGTFVVKKNKKLNILAFVGCFLAAFFIWIYVMNVKINDNSKTFAIKMDIRGQSELLNEKNYSVFGETETLVKVTVQGTNADLNKCSEKDFGVFVDVSDVEKTGLTTLNIVVECKNAAVSVVSTDILQARIFIDEKVKSSVKINSNLENQVKDFISVEGPKTDVSQISSAKLFADPSNKNSFKIVFYDNRNNVVESSYLTYNLSEITVNTDEQ